ncbi:MAG: hypothetical protein IJ678_01055 [Kiritimatiellae bacterium]|nr:hypothetical protein [Kiritimatiellia bacterium]
MNLTLAVDGDILREARKIAIDEDTSVSALVRDFLADLVEARRARRRRPLEEMFRAFDEHPVEIGPVTWTRDELHERR